MARYRTKQNPNVLVSQPMHLENPDGSKTYRTPTGAFNQGQMFHAGFYLDIPPVYNPDTHKTGDVFAWDEVAGTVTVNVVSKTEEEIALETRERFKAARQEIVDNIKVTTSAGNTFDGDETSQTRMARAIIGMQAAGVPTIVWVLADNTVIEATAAELTEAMILAGQAQAAAWVP